MKALYLPALILSLLLGLSLWTGSYVSSRAEEWSRYLEEADRLAQLEQWDLAKVQIDAGYERWSDRQALFHIIMEHQELDEAEVLFAAAYAACDQQDVPDFHAALAQLLTQIRLLAETQQVSLQNIL